MSAVNVLESQLAPECTTEGSYAEWIVNHFKGETLIEKYKTEKKNSFPQNIKMMSAVIFFKSQLAPQCTIKKQQ